MSTTSSKGTKVPYRCSFCGKSQEQVRKLIAGQGVYICDECINLCQEIIEEEMLETPRAKPQAAKLPNPRQIKHALDQYVISQERAKKVLSVAVYNHYKRVNAGHLVDEVELQKSNVLLVGPTGSGKTLLAQTLARVLDVPFCIADATSLTEAGYVGEDVENILLRLIQAADFDVARAQRGIIYIDEIDKIARKADNPSITRDVQRRGRAAGAAQDPRGHGRQRAAAGRPQASPPGLHPDRHDEHPVHLRRRVRGPREDRRGARRQADDGLRLAGADRRRSKREKILEQLMPEDLLKFGLIPEFVGRLPVIVSLSALTRDDLMRVLTEPKNAVTRQFQKFLQLDKVELHFTPGAIEAAAELALNRKTGARALRSIVEESLLEVMYDIPERTDVRKCIITEETIRVRARAAAADQGRDRPRRRRDQLRGAARAGRLATVTHKLLTCDHRARWEASADTAGGDSPSGWVALGCGASRCNVSPRARSGPPPKPTNNSATRRSGCPKALAARRSWRTPPSS